MGLLDHVLMLVLAAKALCIDNGAIDGRSVLSSCQMVRVRYPSRNLNGSSLYLRGSGADELSWDKGVELEALAETDSYGFCVNGVAVGEGVQVKVLVDDKDWQVGANTVLPAVTGPEADRWTVWPFFYSSKGRYEYIRNVASKKLGNTRDLVIYVPPSFDENPLKTYGNAAIFHDGENLFNSSTSFGGVAWRVQDAADRLIVEGDIDELIIIGVDNTAERIFEYTYSKDATYGGGGADVYLDWLESTVLPLIRNQPYRLAGDAVIGMVGSSLGGLVTCYAGWTRSHIYRRVGCMSASFWWNNVDFESVISSHPRPSAPIVSSSRPSVPLPLLPLSRSAAEGVGGVGNRAAFRLYIDSGDTDGDTTIEIDTLKVRGWMEASGLKPDIDLFYYLAKGGSHNEASWGERVDVPLQVLFGPSAGNNRIKARNGVGR